MDALLESVVDPLRKFGYDGRTLGRMRKARGLTQAALAALVGVARQRISQWEASSSEGLSERDLQRYLSGLNSADAERT
jgi:transcriptional regulator with XRE-family HTH domain